MISNNDEYFLAVVQSSSLSKAAGSLYMSQSNLSKHIQSLEYQIGMDLFDHGTKPLQLTEAGRIYYRYILREIEAEKRLMEEMREASEGAIGSLSLGVPGTLGGFLLPEVLSAFTVAFPKVRLRLTEMAGEPLQRLVAAEKLELAFGYSSTVTSSIKSKLLSKGKIFLTVKRDDSVRKLFPDQTVPLVLPLHIQMLNDYRYCLFKKEQLIDAAISRYFQTCQFTPDILLRSGTLQLNLNTVRIMDRCATFIPSYALRGISTADLSQLVFYDANAPELEWELKAFFRDEKNLSPYARFFMNYIERMRFEGS